MRKLLSALLLLPLLAFGGPNDIVVQQRNSTDTGLAPNRLVTAPTGGASAIMGYNGSTQLPIHWSIGSGLAQSGTALTAPPQDWSVITGKPTFASVATSGSYTDLLNRPVIPAAQVQTNWNATTGLGVLLNKPTTLSGYGITDGVSQSALTSTLSGYTTTGALTSGLATKFNTPTGTTSQYVRGDGSLANLPAPGTGTVTSITAGTGLSGGTITTSGTIGMPNTGTVGTYVAVTTDPQGRVTAGRPRSFTYPTRSMNTAYQVSAAQDAYVNYTVDVGVTSLLLAGSTGRVYLDYADNAAMTTNLITVNESPNGTGGVLNVTNIGPGNVHGWIPAGKYVRIRTVAASGTPTFTYVRGEEVLQ